MRSATQSPLVLARMAYDVGRAGLEPYSCKRSPRRYTQAQLFALLVLRQFFKTDYRGLVNGWYRQQMAPDFPAQTYHRRSHIESVFSQHKRLLGSALRARSDARGRTPRDRGNAPCAS